MRMLRGLLTLAFAVGLLASFGGCHHERETHTVRYKGPGADVKVQVEESHHRHHDEDD